ncbi:DNA repair protein REV1, partial [Bienertia sinuspersici]
MNRVLEMKNLPPLEIGKLVTSRTKLRLVDLQLQPASHGSYQSLLENHLEPGGIGTEKDLAAFPIRSNRQILVYMAATSRKLLHPYGHGLFFCGCSYQEPSRADGQACSQCVILIALEELLKYLLLTILLEIMVGVKAGMFVRDAKAHLSSLVIVPYNFEALEVADPILQPSCTNTAISAVSCDEAFLDVTDSDVKDPEDLETTGCTASAGIAANMLMARLATRIAKPDGQCHIPLEKVDKYLLDLPIKSLPGIGHILEQKLKAKGVQTCGQLQIFSKEALQRDFGTKTGEMLWNYCRGVDNRLVGVTQETKSVGADVNWGVRFKDSKDSEHFLSSLCKEVSLRLQGCGLQGRTFTLKIKKRRKDAKEPTKYMGCGDYVKDIRGIGLQVTKLESDDHMKQGHERNSLKSWLASGTMSSSEPCNLRDTGQPIEPNGSSMMISNPSSHETCSNTVAVLPSLEDLDLGVIKSLPPELFSEINDVYGGKLTALISKSKGKAVFQSGSAVSVQEVEGKFLKKRMCMLLVVYKSKTLKRWIRLVVLRIRKESHCLLLVQQLHLYPIPVVQSEIGDLIPSSLSQVDMSILQQLPEELRADIVGALPAHRRSNCFPVSCNISGEPQEVRPAGDRTGFTECTNDYDLWVGNPPCWVHKFKARSSGLLSSTLQCCLSEFRTFNDATDDVDNEASYTLCELLKQYIDFKLEADIEEIYVCFRILK